MPAAQARDVEASLQEQLLEQFHDLVLARAATAGSTGRSQTALTAATDAAALLRPVLAVLPAAGAAGAACLGRACAALHAKKRLKGKAVATGLQTMIQQLTAQGESDVLCRQICSMCTAPLCLMSALLRLRQTGNNSVDPVEDWQL